MGRIVASGRLLGRPFWFWVMLSIALLVLGHSLVLFWVPLSPSEPSDRETIFASLILFTRDGETFQFVPLEQAGTVKPLWVVSVIVQKQGRTAWNTHWVILPGFFRMQGKWTYALTSNRFDRNPKIDDANPSVLSYDEITRLTPRIVEELNRREPSEERGDDLARLLSRGVERTSYLCPQNGIILLSWLSIPVAILAVFVRLRGV